MKLRITFLIVAICACVSAQAKNEKKESTPTGVEIKVTGNDIKIIQRASEILANKSDWNKKDNRECPQGAKTYSLYCALFMASVEINGEFDHRLAALEEVRRTVEAASKGKNYEHRLMGYNNDPATTFTDIKRILKTTELRLEEKSHKNR